MAPGHAEPEGTAKAIQTPTAPVSSTAKRRNVDQQPLFADETWQIRGLPTLATSATQLEKGAASGRESLVIYEDKVSQPVYFVSHGSGTVAGSVAMLTQGQVCCPPPAWPNPSLKGSANGRLPGPGWWYAVHFHQPGPGVLPSSPP
jgi:hypothetical protein